MSVALIQRAHWYHPEWCALAVSAVGWVALVGWAAVGPDHAPGGSPGAPSWVLLAHATAMAMAMMAPLALPQVRHVCRSSLWPRRYRAATAFLIGFLGVWTVASALIMAGGAALVSRLGWLPVIAVAFGLACLACLSPRRRTLVRHCALTGPLRIRGWGADRDCLTYGVASARRCLLTCVPLMAAAMVDHRLLALAGTTGIAVAERRRPDLDPTQFALAVAVLGMACVLSALALGSSGGHLMPM